jgi:hypothetical protein
MFTLARFLVSLAMFVMLIWFATTVNLGKRTLWGHLHAIFATQEAKDLAEGAKEEAHKVADEMRKEIHPDGGDKAERHSRQPLDPVGERDQRSLDKLVHDKTHKK